MPTNNRIGSVVFAAVLVVMCFTLLLAYVEWRVQAITNTQQEAISQCITAETFDDSFRNSNLGKSILLDLRLIRPKVYFLPKHDVLGAIDWDKLPKDKN